MTAKSWSFNHKTQFGCGAKRQSVGYRAHVVVIARRRYTMLTKTFDLQSIETGYHALLSDNKRSKFLVPMPDSISPARTCAQILMSGSI